MTREEASNNIKELQDTYIKCRGEEDAIEVLIDSVDIEAFDMAIKALEQEPIDKSAMMYDIYMEGVNMTGEYQGCWVRFKDIEKIVNKYIGSEET